MSAPTTVREALLAAAELLEKPGAWTQGENARDEFAVAVDPLAREATCWCIEGAMLRVMGSKRPTGASWSAVIMALKEVPCDWNDTPGRTQAEVVAKLREAAEACP